MQQSLCIIYGNGIKRILSVGDKVVIDEGIRTYYSKIPQDVVSLEFEIVGFTKKGVPKIRGVNNHIYMVSAENIQTVEEYAEYLEFCNYMSKFHND